MTKQRKERKLTPQFYCKDSVTAQEKKMSSEDTSPKDISTGTIEEEETAPVAATMTKKEVTTDDEMIVDEGDDDVPTTKKTYRQRAKENGMSYTVTDVPPLGTSLLLGLQHYLTMLGATVLIPLIVCPAMGASGSETARVISSIFFVSGINTVRNGSTTRDRKFVNFGLDESYPFFVVVVVSHVPFANTVFPSITFFIQHLQLLQTTIGDR